MNYLNRFMYLCPAVYKLFEASGTQDFILNVLKDPDASFNDHQQRTYVYIVIMRLDACMF